MNDISIESIYMISIYSPILFVTENLISIILKVNLFNQQIVLCHIAGKNVEPLFFV